MLSLLAGTKIASGQVVNQCRPATLLGLLVVLISEPALSNGVDAIDPVKGCVVSVTEVARYIRKNRENFSFTVDGTEKIAEDWQIDARDHGGGLAYSEYFAPALEGKSIEQYAQERSRDAKSIHVADFFGSAVFSSSPNRFSSLTGIRIKPLKNDRLPSEYPVPHWKEVVGDVYDKKTWSDLDAHMQQRHIPKFDLILCRPEAPLHGLSAHFLDSQDTHSAGFLAMNFAILSKMWARLSEDNGVMIVQLNQKVLQSPKFLRWLKQQETKGTNAQLFFTSRGNPPTSEPILKLLKTPTSPATLPILEAE